VFYGDESINEIQTQIDRQKNVYQWFEQDLGRSVQAIELDRLRPVLASLFAVRAAQIGGLGSFDLMNSCSAPSRYIVDVNAAPSADIQPVRALPETLPFDNRSIDLALLPHTLDFSKDPHQVLREIERVLVPEGHVVILGFNPLSLWGLRRLFIRKARRDVPWNANFIGLRRIKDWLSLIHFDVTAGCMLYYRPPVSKPSLQHRLQMLDKMGDRWWPMAAAAYLLVAKKRVVGMTPIRPKWRMQLIKSGLVQTGNSCRTSGDAAKLVVVKK
jgi:SAM-dependent methyltransferase